jgi:predicted amino acid dehydrogenase
LSTGNALTAAVGVRRVLRMCGQSGLDPAAEETRLAVVGAGGNIGAMLSQRFLLGDRPFRRATLVGRDGARLERLRLRLLTEWEARGGGGPPPDVRVSTDLADLGECNVIICAAGTSELLIDAQHLRRSGPVLLADLSVPGVVTARALALPHVRTVPFAGTVSLPQDPDFAMASHIAPGTAFSCAAETMLVGMEPEATAGLRLVGEVDPRAFQLLDALAERHGLLRRLAPPEPRTRRARG